MDMPQTTQLYANIYEQIRNKKNKKQIIMNTHYTITIAGTNCGIFFFLSSILFDNNNKFQCLNMETKEYNKKNYFMRVFLFVLQIFGFRKF